MKIGLFALETGRNVGGLEVYETNVIRSLVRLDKANRYVVFCLDPIVPEILDVPNVEYCVLPVNRFKGVAWDVPRAMRRHRIDLFHALFVPPPVTSIPYVFTMHGSEPLKRPDFYPLALGLRMRFLYGRALKHARLILCVSDFVRNYLATEQRISAERLRTVYPGCGPEFAQMIPENAGHIVESRFGLREPYLLCVGRIEPRKNPLILLKAYHRFRARVTDAPKLVLAGNKTWSASEVDRLIAQLQLKPHIVELGHIAHSDLPALYSAAHFSVFPSLWEGFGLPAIEAMASGSPLITSNSTSLPEVTGGAAILVDPSSETDLAEAMCQLHQDSRLRIKLRSQGLARARLFTWETTALQTVRCYEMALGRKQ